MSDERRLEPNIRYATAEDGTSIAFWTLGEGSPFVFTPPYPLGNLNLEWGNPLVRAFYRRLALSHTLVRYDPRGSGLSSREVNDYSISALCSDISAVADQAGLERFALLGFGHLGPASVSYAVAHTDRVSHLVLWYSYARYSDYVRNPRIEAARSLIDQDWDLYAELEGYRITNWSGGEEARWYTEFLRQSVTPAGLKAAFEAFNGVDITDLLPRVAVPTLVLHREDNDVLSLGVPREIAAAIPDARLALVRGVGISPFGEGAETILAEIDEFLAAKESAPSGLTPREVEVLRLVASGKSNTAIGAELDLSVRTVARHVTNVYGKIGVQNRAEATAFAIRHRVI